MIRKWFGISALILTAMILLSTVNCGRSQQLVGIQIQPATETFGDSNTPVFDNKGAQVQLRALGSYIHPPVTKDITNDVTWNSNTPQMFTVDTTGLLTATGLACGSTLVSATVTTNKSQGNLSSSGALVTGYMTASVVCFTGSGGGGGNPALTLTFQGTGSGTVSSNPSGFSCASPGPCVTQLYPSGTTVMLTATPTPPSTTATWASCPSASSNVCTIDLSGNTTVTVSFN